MHEAFRQAHSTIVINKQLVRQRLVGGCKKNLIKLWIHWYRRVLSENTASMFMVLVWNYLQITTHMHWTGHVAGK